MRSRNRLPAAAGVVMAVAACSLAIPGGDVPRIAQRWVVTPLAVSIGMDELINPNQRLSMSNVAAAHGPVAYGDTVRTEEASNGGPTESCAFPDVGATMESRENRVIVNVPRTTLECSLKDLCQGCSGGLQRKPALTLERRDTFPLPDRNDLSVKSIRVTAGTIKVSLDHDLGFVPLKRGQFAIEVWSAGDTIIEREKLTGFSLGQDLVGGKPVSHTHDFDRDPATVVGGIELVVRVNAPAGSDIVNVDLNRPIRVTAEVEDLTVSAAAVLIDKPIGLDPEPIDVDDDTVSEIIDRVTGTTTITITFINPFPIEMQGTIDLGEAVSLTDAQKSVTVRPGTRDEPAATTKELAITRDQLKAFLERGQFAFTGNVSTGGVVDLDTDQEIRVRVEVDVSVVTEPEDA